MDGLILCRSIGMIEMKIRLAILFIVLLPESIIRLNTLFQQV